MRSIHVLVLLLPILQLCFQAQAASLSMVKNNVNRTVKRLVNRLENVPIPPTLTTSPPSWEQPYNYTVCYVIQFLNMSSKLISDSFNLAQDIKSELVSLSGFLDESKQCNCINVSSVAPPKALVELKANQLSKSTQGKLTQSHRATLTVYHLLKKYLKNLQEKLDQLDTC